jgi:alpha-beta hydrolase superfamily lysophospholipase
MIQEVNTPEWAAKVPKIPLFNIAGEEDPCGSFGEGVELVSKWLEETEHDIETMIYIGYRHEIHNYSDLKDQVEEDMIDFLDRIVK